jgi:phosphoglycerate dehydrogenase-like enzyme
MNRSALDASTRNYTVKNYTVAQPFWRQGILLETGEKLRLTDAEAKHIKHLLNEAKDADAAPAPQPKPEDFAAAEGTKSVESAPAGRDGTDPEAVAQASRIVAAVKARKVS